ncbi:hypothetical protein [Novosphingobium guangzhouense]|uniref:Phage holin family protein n=1 Tax=Novosphingobium guangzhouense TaxID=1850347 RepID=A0A2K2G554_9SPHN|nr:hypothetical protein [Novosphingobium guangzhouense]PNU06164.1 hypothetical protein A8V01_12475 [Novosphingobium guangzhouense]
MQDNSPSLAPAAEDHENLSLAQDLRRLADEAKAFAQAEITFQKSRAAFVGAETRSIVLLLIVAATLVFFAAMAFVVGTVIALGPVLGLWGAMAAVTLVLLMLAVFGALNARARLRRMMRIAGGSQDD